MDIDDRATKAIGMSNGDSRQRERDLRFCGEEMAGRREREKEAESTKSVM